MSSLITLLKNQDKTFLSSLMASTGSEELLLLADCWKQDRCDWAKSQQMHYVDVALTCPGHEQLFRYLFRHAEASQDHRLMGRFLVALDRAVRRRRVTVVRCADGIKFTEDVLRAVPNRIRLPEQRQLRQTHQASTGTAETADRVNSGRPPDEGDRLFSQTTRAHLRRRTWAYFRRLSETDVGAYVNAAAEAMKSFSDEDFSSGENIIDHRSLMHICFANSPVLSFGVAHITVVAGYCLNDLEPAPWMETAWETSSARLQLLQLAAESDASLIRWWAATLYSRSANDSTEGVDKQMLLRMVRRDECAVQELAASLVRSCLDQSENPDLLAFLTAPSAAVRVTALEWAGSNHVKEDVLRHTCRGVVEMAPHAVLAGLLRVIHSRQNNLVIDEEFAPFLLASLTVRGCSRRRTWILNQLLRLMGHQQETAELLATALRNILSAADPALQWSILGCLSEGSLRSPEFKSAIEMHLPEIGLSTAVV